MAPIAPLGALALHLLDVGQGEAILIDLPDGSFALIDAGPRADAAGVLEKIERRRACGRTFRFAAVTQWDRDHAAGMPAVLREHKPDVLYTSGVDMPLLERLAGDDGRIVRETRNVRVEEKRLNARDRVPVPNGVTLLTLSPYGKLGEEIREKLRPGMSAAQIKRLRNRASLALWMSFAGRIFFLSGELEDDQYDSVAELWTTRYDPLNQYGSPEADWIKLSHHGADANNPEVIFQYFAKDLVVASASAGGRYGHPHPRALSLIPSGGLAMCTRLGTGCALIQRNALDPRQPNTWLHSYPSLAAQASPNKACFGTVSVEVTPTGPNSSRCTIRGESVQLACPYGGPATGHVALH